MECCLSPFGPRPHESHTSFLVDLGLLNFVFAIQNGWLDNIESSSGLCGNCSIAAFSMSEIATANERPSIWDCISSKHSYEGNPVFQIGNDGEIGERRER